MEGNEEQLRMGVDGHMSDRYSESASNGLINFRTTMGCGSKMILDNEPG